MTTDEITIKKSLRRSSQNLPITSTNVKREFAFNIRAMTLNIGWSGVYCFVPQFLANKNKKKFIFLF